MKDLNLDKRIYGLDLMRSFAIIYVMLSHGVGYLGSVIDVKYYGWLLFDGVNLFFVLSGFLIGGILIKIIREKQLTPGELMRFWIRRWFRTLPNYYLVLIILVFCYYFVHKELPPKTARYFTFTQNFASPHPLFFGEAWSLSVEEWFYLLVPATLFLLLRFTGRRDRSLLLGIIGVLVAGTCIRIFKVSQHDYFSDNSFGPEISKQVVTRMDGIMYGMLGAWLSVYRSGYWLKFKNGLFIIGLLLLTAGNLLRSEFFTGYVYFSVIGMAALMLLPKLSSLKKGSGIIFKTMTWISLLSYSMYLTNHMIVQRAILSKLQQVLPFMDPRCAVSGIALFLLFWTLTIFFSYLLYRFWERPIMQLRDRITDKRAA